MNYLITDFIFPLDKPLIISKKYNFMLDNPRSVSEIEFLKDRIKSAHTRGNDLKLPPRANNKYISLKSMLLDIKSYFESDEYLRELFVKYPLKNNENIYYLIASMCIIARFDDEGEYKNIQEAYEEMQQNEVNGFVLLDSKNPIEVNSNMLLDFSYLLSLLINTQNMDYIGRGFISTKFDKYSIYSGVFIQNLMLLDIFCRSPKDKQSDDESRWLIFPLVRDSIIATSKRIDDFLLYNNSDSLLYIANMLKIANHDVKDENIKLVMLTSIVEFLLTRNPDFNRFNVEDSINKQFQLKASIIIYQNIKNCDIEEVKNDLKTIYKLRSSIAHGDFKELKKYTDKDEYFIESLNCKLYYYIKCIIEEYLKDSKFIESIKKS